MLGKIPKYRKAAIRTRVDNTSEAILFFSMVETKVDACSEITLYSVDSLPTAEINVSMTLARISVSGSSRPRSNNGMSADISCMYVVCGIDLIRDVRATRYAECL